MLDAHYLRVWAAAYYYSLNMQDASALHSGYHYNLSTRYGLNKFDLAI